MYFSHKQTTRDSINERTRSHLKSVFLIFKMSQKKAEFSHLKKLVPKNTEILPLFLQEM